MERKKNKTGLSKGKSMQIIFLSPIEIVVVSTILWPIFQLTAILISRKLPSVFFSPNNILFRERKWEKNGCLYENFFRIRKWKKYLPDGAAIRKDGYRKKNINDFSNKNLSVFVEETCRAELGHILGILPFWLFGLFAPSSIIGIMFIYALLVNLPCILAQRYNRPRIIRLAEKMESKLLK